MYLNKNNIQSRAEFDKTFLLIKIPNGRNYGNNNFFEIM